MKKKLTILSLLVFALAVIAITFALPTFRINKINLLKDSKINEIKKSLDSEYAIKEPEITASDSEEYIIKKAYEAVSLLIGKPNTKIENDYFSIDTKFNEFLKYCYDNVDLPTDTDGKISSDYSYYVLDENNTKEDEFIYSFEELMDLKISQYEDLKIVDFYTYNGIDYTITFRAKNAQFKIMNTLTRIYEDAIGDVDIRVRLIKYNSVKILSLSTSYDTLKGEKVTEKGNSEVNSLIGKLSYNDIKEREYTQEETKQIEDVYNKYKDSIVALSTSNVNNAITSNATGFFVRKGIILTNWTWFENYLLGTDTLTISDINNRIYHVDGVVSISTVYDIVALKLTEEVGSPITTTGYVSGYRKDLVISLTSPTSIGIATNVGEVIEEESNIYKLNLVINDGEVGSPLFNVKGELVGIINSNQLNSTISFASDYSTFSSMMISFRFDRFDKITSYNLLALKNNMYTNITGNLELAKEYDLELYNKYMADFDIKKAYGDSVLSVVTKDDKMTIKVEFNENSIISKKQYVNLYVSKLKSAGYQIIGSNDYQMILTKNNIRVNIKYESGYIVIAYRGVGNE